MAIDPAERRSRRAILVSAVGGAAALAASQLVKPGAALGASGTVNIDLDNLGDGTTSITTSAPVAAFAGVATQPGEAIGVAGKSTYVSDGTNYCNIGVYGLAGAESPDWTPMDDFETGVFGFCDGTNPNSAPTGVAGVSPHGTGVYAYGDTGAIGDGGTIGVFGFTQGTGTGVFGYAGAIPPGGIPVPGNVGVMAKAAAAGTALWVDGRTRFSRSGRSAVSSGKTYKDVPVPGGVSSASQIIATATKYVSGTYVQAAVYRSSTVIRVYLNKKATTTVYFAWIVLN
jgi:hypothetical protein